MILTKIKDFIADGFWAWFSLSLILIGISLRVWSFGSLPLSLNRDEAALGYNAYALANYGVDEWGKPWPFTFLSFGDYKLPGYIYTLAPLIKVFGSTDAVVRLPSLIAGVVNIFLTGAIVWQVKKKRALSLFAAALMAIQPWAIFYSRMAWEAHLGLMWLLGAILVFLKKSNVKHLLLFALFYTFSVLTYNAPLLLSPLLMLTIWIAPQKSKKEKTTYSFIIVLIAAIIFALLIPLTSQKQGITIFSDPQIAEEQRQQYQEAATLFQKAWRHRFTKMARISLLNMAQTFSPEFLSLRGGSHPWHSVPGAGHIYWSMYVIVSIGILYLIKEKKWRQVGIWALLLAGSTLPASITTDAPHATRSLLTLWLLPLLGLITWENLKKLRWLIAFFLVIELSIFAYNYFFTFPHNMPVSWPRGIREALDSAPQEGPITFAPEEGYDPSLIEDQPYVYVLLYQKISPHLYQQTVQYYPQDAANLYRVKAFDRYTFVNNREDILEASTVITKRKDGTYVYQP